VLRSFEAAAVAAAVVVAVTAGVSSGAVHPANDPAIGGIERNLASALEKAKTKHLLSFHRHRTPKAPVDPKAPVEQRAWVDLATGKRLMLSYNVSGGLTSTEAFTPTHRSDASWNANAACGCGLDPFTDFSPQAALHASLLGNQTINGKQTLHLRFTGTMGTGPFTIDFWIDRSTYLPLRLKWKTGQLASAMTTTDQFTWLPRTSANLGHLASG
jgi:hypothetical protein